LVRLNSAPTNLGVPRSEKQDIAKQWKLKEKGGNERPGFRPRMYTERGVTFANPTLHCLF